MKKLLSMAFVALLSAHTMASEIAVLDFRAALLQSDAGQEAAQAPRQQVDQMKARLDQENRTLKDMVESLKRDELTLSADQLAERRAEVNKKQAQLRQMVAAMQQQAQQMEQQLIQNLTPMGEAALKELIDERNLDAVISRQAAIYTNESVDITAELIEKLNKEK
ncbi:Outer membrane protein (OmpH-like) [Marinomonas aquimarina]|uniref:Outer membrane protein (OmpH-like) n=1 Tax=Marinomonas aquimarina TaxID=295068 RepID=A0A1A8TQA9_9GAMM|nr:OmpH family outer membrane protein [Marinomonas aquimarina]SBS34988.1 Outer membrane protein (OmpH-like) [Marinomonas aquimarina]